MFNYIKSTRLPDILKTHQLMVKQSNTLHQKENVKSKKNCVPPGAVCKSCQQILPARPAGPALLWLDLPCCALDRPHFAWTCLALPWSSLTCLAAPWTCLTSPGSALLRPRPASLCLYLPYCALDLPRFAWTCLAAPTTCLTSPGPSLLWTCLVAPWTNPT